MIIYNPQKPDIMEDIKKKVRKRKKQGLCTL